MGTQPKPRYAAPKDKVALLAYSQGKTRQPYGHATVAKPVPIGMGHGQGSPNRHTAKTKACCYQGQGTSTWEHSQGQDIYAAKA